MKRIQVNVVQTATGKARCKMCRKKIPKGAPGVKFKAGAYSAWFCECVYREWQKYYDSFLLRKNEKIPMMRKIRLD